MARRCRGGVDSDTPPRTGYGRWMNEQQLSDLIDQLENEQSRLRSGEEAAANSGDEVKLAGDRTRIAEIKLQLEQLWDLQRQRTALTESGQNPDDAQVRDTSTIENYKG
jgi:hypothetical protein